MFNKDPFKYPNYGYDRDYENILLKRKENERNQFREKRKKKLQEFKEQELIKQIDIQYRRKKLESIGKLYERLF